METPEYDYAAPRVIREYRVPVLITNPVTHWDDGVAGRAVTWPSDLPIGEQLAEQFATALHAMSAVVNDDAEVLSDPGELRAAFNALRQARRVLGMLEDELLLAARGDAAPGEKGLLSWREIANELGVHHTSVTQRHERLAAGAGKDERAALFALEPLGLWRPGAKDDEGDHDEA